MIKIKKNTHVNYQLNKICYKSRRTNAKFEGKHTINMYGK